VDIVRLPGCAQPRVTSARAARGVGARPALKWRTFARRFEDAQSRVGAPAVRTEFERCPDGAAQAQPIRPFTRATSEKRLDQRAPIDFDHLVVRALDERAGGE
jgi:hypothetical protein